MCICKTKSVDDKTIREREQTRKTVLSYLISITHILYSYFTFDAHLWAGDLLSLAHILPVTNNLLPVQFLYIFLALCQSLTISFLYDKQLNSLHTSCQSLRVFFLYNIQCNSLHNSGHDTFLLRSLGWKSPVSCYYFYSSSHFFLWLMISLPLPYL